MENQTAVVMFSGDPPRSQRNFDINNFKSNPVLERLLGRSNQEGDSPFGLKEVINRIVSSESPGRAPSQKSEAGPSPY